MLKLDQIVYRPRDVSRLNLKRRIAIYAGYCQVKLGVYPDIVRPTGVRQFIPEVSPYSRCASIVDLDSGNHKQIGCPVVKLAALPFGNTVVT
jgi:hypothetical protein